MCHEIAWLSALDEPVCLDTVRLPATGASSLIRADAFVKLNSFTLTQFSLNHLSPPVLKESQLRPIRMKNGREPGDLTGGEQLGPLQMLLFGALSGASAEAVVYPMEVIRRRMQVQAASASTAGQSCHSLVLMPGAWQLHV